MGGLDQGTGLCRPGRRAAGLRKRYAETGHEQVGEEGDEQEACPKARVAVRCYRPGCSQTSSGPYTCPEWCGMTPVSSALKGKSILVILESIIPMASKRRPPCGPARPVRLLPLSCEQPQPHNEPEGGSNGQQFRAAAELNGMLRTRGGGRVAGGRRPRSRRRSCEAAGETRSRDGQHVDATTATATTPPAGR